MHRPVSWLGGRDGHRPGQSGQAGGILWPGCLGCSPVVLGEGGMPTHPPTQPCHSRTRFFQGPTRNRGDSPPALSLLACLRERGRPPSSQPCTSPPCCPSAKPSPWPSRHSSSGQPPSSTPSLFFSQPGPGVTTLLTPPWGWPAGWPSGLARAPVAAAAAAPRGGRGRGISCGKEAGGAPVPGPRVAERGEEAGRGDGEAGEGPLVLLERGRGWVEGFNFRVCSCSI